MSSSASHQHPPGLLLCLLCLLRDLWRLVIDSWCLYGWGRVRTRTGFAFLVHPRDWQDIVRTHPYARWIPARLADWVMRHLPPITLSRITGATSLSDGRPISGWLISTPLDPGYILSDPVLWKQKIRDCVRLAERKGAGMIGLGGLLASSTRHGLALCGHTSSALTSGHAFTAYAVVRWVEEAVRLSGAHWSHETVAVLGAAGSIGSATARLLVAEGHVRRLLLVDVPLQRARLDALQHELQAAQPNLQVTLATRLDAITAARFVVVATNATDALLRSEHLCPGAWIVDDSQPRNVSPQLLQQRPDLHLLDVLACYPGLDCHYNLGLADIPPGINFTCLIETVVLASHGHFAHFCLGPGPDPELIHRIAEMARHAGVELAPPITFGRLRSAD